MMEQSYFLWNAKLGGWLTGSATYGTDLAKAKSFSKADALARCHRQYNSATEEFTLLPVRETDVWSIAE